MTDPVDLTNLREMTDGDKEMEKILFEEFFNSSEECVSILEKNCSDGENETWRKNAHALKGTSINLGATKLSSLFKMAQENHGASIKEKQKMLADIKTEYLIVKNFLNSIK